MKLKKYNRKDVSIGSLVVVTDEPEAQVYTVEYIADTGLSVCLKYRSGTHISQSWSDISLLLVPTLRQIEDSIAIHGPLVSRKEI